MTGSAACVALGSNLPCGERSSLQLLQHATELLHATPGVRVIAVSRIYASPAVGGAPGQPEYVNAAVLVECSLTARALLVALFEIESQCGRQRVEGKRNEPRTLDLDLVLWDDACIDEPGVCVPHPRMTERAFVLLPLLDLLPSAIHPKTSVPLASFLQSCAPEAVSVCGNLCAPGAVHRPRRRDS